MRLKEEQIGKLQTVVAGMLFIAREGNMLKDKKTYCK
jgi:hypothetical protein